MIIVLSCENIATSHSENHVSSIATFGECSHWIKNQVLYIRRRTRIFSIVKQKTRQKLNNHKNINHIFEQLLTSDITTNIGNVFTDTLLKTTWW